MSTRPISRIETITSLRTANADGAFATAFTTLVAGVFLVGFVQSLGGSDMWIGVLSAIPSLAGFLQIPGAIWGRGFSSYKRFVWPGGLFWRLFYVPLIVLPILPLNNGFRLFLLTLFVALASGVTNITGPIYNDWIAEMVPPQSRGFYFSRRNAIMTAVGAAVGILGAVGLDALRGVTGDKFGFSAVFALGLVCAAISMWFFNRMPDLPREHPVRQNLRAGIKAIGAPFGDRAYRRVLIFLGFSTLGQTFPGNLFTAYARESLNLNFEIIQGLQVSIAIGTIVSAATWGFFADKYGNKPLLIITGFALACNVIPWVLTRPGAPVYDSALLLSTHFLMGLVWCGLNLCQFNLMLATAKPEDRANYLGAAMTVMSLVGGFSPILGAALMATLRHSLLGSIPPQEAVATAYKIVFLATGACRFIAVFFLLRVSEEGASHIKTTLRDLGGITPRGVRAVRTLARSSDIDERAEAIADVGEGRLRLASDEIIRALHDPLPSVRRQAAEALARLSDPRAVDELIHQLQEHPDLLEEEAVQALGSLGHPSAVPALITTLASPTSLIRRASARALTQIADKTGGETGAVVEQALIRAAAQVEDPDLRRSALQGLRRIGGPSAAGVIGASLLDPLPSVRIAAAEACSELNLAACHEAVRTSLATFHDEANAEVAFALGVVGTFDDLSLILSVAADSVSIITRRRALLGAARLLGVQGEVYRLMLLGEMAQDTALLELARGSGRRDPVLRAALNDYGSGDEAGALKRLAETNRDPAFNVFAVQPVEELFFVAIAMIASRKR
jgi:HEAT repeat protein/MFS family permease